MKQSPDDGRLRRIDDPFAVDTSNIFDGGGGIAGIETRAAALSPTYENGTYTWPANSFADQTLNAVNASEQFPVDGFLPGPTLQTVFAPSSSKATTPQDSSGLAPAAAPGLLQSIPVWVWVALAAVLLLGGGGRRR